MANPQVSKQLKVHAITAATTYTNFEEVIILDDASVGFSLTDIDNNTITFAGGITSIHIGGPGKPVDKITITPTSGTINILLYR